MSRQERLDRRRFLKALGNAASALPFYRLLESSAVGATRPPLRLITVYSPNGYWRPFWNPRLTSETDFTFQFEHSSLAPLEPFKSKLLVLDGIDYKVNVEKNYDGNPSAGAHGIGDNTPFTATVCLGGVGKETPTGPSIDQLLAEKLGGTTRQRSVRLSVGNSHDHSMSFNALGRRLPAIIRPADAFNLLFGQGVPVAGDPAAEEAAGKAMARRVGLVSALKADVDELRLRPHLPAAERHKLDEHLAALADLEKRIKSTAAVTAGCANTGAPAPQTGDRNAITPAVSRQQIDLLVQALACDITRFAHLNYHFAGYYGTMPYAGPELNVGIHHQIAHLVASVAPEKNILLSKVSRWYATELAYMLQRLSAIREGDGTLLDNVIIIWANELGQPSLHDIYDVPFLVAGGGGGKLATGRYIDYKAHIPTPYKSRHDCRQIKPPIPGCSDTNRRAHLVAHNGLHVAICRAFGLDVDYFNDPDYRGALPGILA